jgi:hypothetical protein
VTTDHTALRHPQDSPAVWRSTDLSSAEWSIALTDRQRDEIATSSLGIAVVHAEG